MSKKNNKIIFEKWFSIELPSLWDYHIDEAILNIYPRYNQKGIIQVSFFHRRKTNDIIQETAMKHLNSFISQNEIIIYKESCKMISKKSFVIISEEGLDNDDFIKMWTIVNDNKMFLITYISPTKSEELLIVDRIINSIDLDEEL